MPPTIISEPGASIGGPITQVVAGCGRPVGFRHPPHVEADADEAAGGRRPTDQQRRPWRPLGEHAGDARPRQRGRERIGVHIDLSPKNPVVLEVDLDASGRALARSPHTSSSHPSGAKVREAPVPSVARLCCALVFVCYGLL